jgi:putative N-acetyltransferase (TIGR04045 family)
MTGHHSANVAAPTRQLGVRIRLATSQAERDDARALRRAVFCDEQGLFDGDDSDGADVLALPIAAILSAPGAPDQLVGTVRIHRDDAGAWWGSRLAVAPAARGRTAVGSGLIRMAVGTAHALGCRAFYAHVQHQNVAMFERLHWHSLAELTLHGRVHQLMQADLAHYPPITDSAAGFLCTREGA